MIPWEKILEKLGTWAPLFKPFYDSGGFEAIYTQLKEQGKTIKIVPEGPDLFKAFALCPKDDLKAILVGMSPYSSIKQGVVVSDGLAFSCSNTKQEQPSLKLLFDAMEDDLFDGMNLNATRNPDLSYLAKDGVLLLNAILTTPEGSADAHKALWKPFMEFFFKEAMSHISGIPIVFFSKVAAEYEPLVNLKMNFTKCVEHPSFAARENRPLKHNKLFTFVNSMIKGNTNREINWANVPF